MGRPDWHARGNVLREANSFFKPARRELPASRKARCQPLCDPGVMTLRCLIVDDSPRFLDAARGLLERQGVTVVAVASTGRLADSGHQPRIGTEAAARSHHSFANSGLLHAAGEPHRPCRPLWPPVVRGSPPCQ